ncbi:hypothetical protein VNO77_07502 [Canavalia gladiata]|uniref:Uncharacterized protein n=1 Tax=Canavalia gladiata TaxID=3824 RepID=A0AAN9R0M2_CANGL
MGKMKILRSSQANSDLVGEKEIGPKKKPKSLKLYRSSYSEVIGVATNYGTLDLVHHRFPFSFASLKRLKQKVKDTLSKFQRHALSDGILVARVQ